MKASTLFEITLVLLLNSYKAKGNQKMLEVRQPLLIKATAGESVTISCFFETESPSFTVKWTLCCDPLNVVPHNPRYKDRVYLSSTFQELSIVNVTQEDSEKYCCEVLTADGEMGIGNGTFLDVAPPKWKEESTGCPLHTICIVIEVIRLACLAIIIILLCVITKKLP